ncbi:polysaccharide pyruvyl transferase family protein [Zeimonas arvi]|uniref:Polysaccharide pyruvyl transferase family protein n=1 Tax=Zeimonas arvi TaxID=2498847 RepID=A0A5C8NUQ8_9BURK|nr:polysaccharide pyruvyl transferase family protein [Zeimonas arvi]TXL64842.1 polysaccharide pyruvyl transferase family protein [Zeimonas arvi]
MQRPPTILFGAFDRHNLGDLLFPHVAAALLPGRELLFAGLADRDLRALGGHRVRPLGTVAAELATRPDAAPATLIHVGGEILCCDAWQAAVMLLPDDEVAPIIARLDAQPAARMAWAQQRLADATGDPRARAPYVAARARFPAIARVLHAGVGGADLDRRDPALRAEVLAKLASADGVAVRDQRSLAQLEAAGLAPRLVPDPAVMVAELFGARIAERRRAGEPARVQRAFPRGYLAVQFAAEFGDDATLANSAGQLDRIAAATGLGIVLFRAGAAPWHDSLEVLQRAASRFRTAAVAIFESLDVWDLCALIAGSRGFCGSSLHGRIVAMAFGLPRVNLAIGAGGPPARAGEEGPASDEASASDPDPAAKHRAFAETWELPGLPGVVDIGQLAEGLHAALAADPEQLARLSRRLVEAYRPGFDAILAAAR